MTLDTRAWSLAAASALALALACGRPPPTAADRQAKPTVRAGAPTPPCLEQPVRRFEKVEMLLASEAPLAVIQERATTCARLAIVDLRDGRVTGRVALGEREEWLHGAHDPFIMTWDSAARRASWRRVQDAQIVFSEAIMRQIAPDLPYFKDELERRIGGLQHELLVPTTDGHAYRFDPERRTHARLEPEQAEVCPHGHCRRDDESYSCANRFQDCREGCSGASYRTRGADGPRDYKTAGEPRQRLSFGDVTSADSFLRPRILREATACKRPYTNPDPLPIIVLHERSLEPTEAALLSRLREDGSTAWTTELVAPSRHFRGEHGLPARHRLVGDDLVTHHCSAHGASGCVDLQRIDLDTGELVWELRAPR